MNDLTTQVDNVEAYIPSEEAMKFIAFIRAAGVEENDTPEIHYKLADKYFSNHKQVMIESFRGSAKALALNERVYVADGSTKTIEDVSIGEYIYGADGKLTKVIAKSEVFTDKDAYEVELSDGRTITCSDDHLWSVKQKGAMDGVSKNLKTLTTKEMYSTQYYSRAVDERNPKGLESKYYLPLTDPVEYSEKDLPVDPYTLGVVIGDDSVDKITGYSRITSHNDDAEELFSYIPYRKGKNSTPNKSSEFRGILGIGNRIKDLGLNVNTYNKYIPSVYKTASVDQRVALLQGLMDTDGTAGKYQSSFCTVNKTLAEDVYALCTGLGLRTLLSAETNSSIGYYRIHLTHRGFNPFRLKRKADKVLFGKKNDYQKIKEIRKVGTVPSQCIMVDNESKLFLTTNHVVTHNSTLMEWYIIYAAVNGEVANFGKVDFIAFVGDSSENGVKNFFRNLQTKIERSDFLQQFLEVKRCTTEEAEIVNVNGHQLNIKGYGMKALALTTKLHSECGTKTIGNCEVGDVIIGGDGKPCTITHKSEVFNKPMYKLLLSDGRSIKVSNDHINSIVRKTNFNNKARYVELDMTTEEILGCELFHTRKRKGYESRESLFFIKNNEPVEYSHKEFIIDPYTLGLLLGDGSTSQSVRLHGHVDDMYVYKQYIPYKVGKPYVDKRNSNVVSYSVLGLQQAVKDLGINVHSNGKFIPAGYFKGSIPQRLELLQGLMDTDGTVSSNGKTTFTSNSKQLVLDVMELCRSLGGKATITDSKTAYVTELWINKPLFKLPRKLSKQKFNKDNKVAIEDIKLIPAEPSQCIAVDNEEHQFIVDDYVRTHNTNIRGVRYKGMRPDIVILDDVTTNDAITSETIRNTIKDNFYKAIMPALHPTKYRLFVIGTPISENDLLSKLRSNSRWVVHRFPVCEKFPCAKESFQGNWEDRFDYEAVLDKYETFKEDGQLQSFYQEYMLEITDLSTLLVDEDDVQWFDPNMIEQNKYAYNFYISTDFATSTKKSADYSTIGVWAISSNNDWLLVDGQCKRQTMQENINDLFRFVYKWKPLSVGIESSGQQGGFISIIQEMMMKRNIWFTFAKKEGSKELGIRPIKDKVHRFITGVQPKFKQNKVWFPKPELLTNKNPNLLALVEEMSQELSKFTMAGGVKSLNHDDAIDLLNQLSEMEKFTPSEDAGEESARIIDGDILYSVWDDDDDEENQNGSTIF